MMDDATAIYVLGHLSVITQQSPEHELMALWAPFLLLHLGGPICYKPTSRFGFGFHQAPAQVHRRPMTQPYPCSRSPQFPIAISHRTFTAGHSSDASLALAAGGQRHGRMGAQGSREDRGHRDHNPIPSVFLFWRPHRRQTDLIEGASCNRESECKTSHER
ncbi:hypothetical protein BS78_06G016500 [Paspalum vaginatum]|nr:hypothetical protein BS78_06G016500 [Paspalum vaginatum]